MYASRQTGGTSSWTSIGPNWAAKISWNAVSGATSYEVQHRTPKTGNAWKADPDYSSGTSYISTGLKDYNSYDYRVRAVNAKGTSDWTEYKLEKTSFPRLQLFPEVAKILRYISNKRIAMAVM